MAKKKMMQNGDDSYVAKDEKYNKKMKKKDAKSMKTAGVANALKKSQSKMGYAKLPKVKPSKKV